MLSTVLSCRDLGITVSHDLSPSAYSYGITVKAHQRANIIFRSFVSRDVSLLFRAYLTYRKTSSNSPRRLFVHWAKNYRRLIETRRLLETRRLFVSCTNGKILVPVTQGNYIMFTRPLPKISNLVDWQRHSFLRPPVADLREVGTGAAALPSLLTIYLTNKTCQFRSTG